MKRVQRTYSGTKNPEVSKREICGREVARRAAAEGIVLLKNEGVLPLKKGSRVAVLGSGAGRTIKGGTGSGDVNERESVTVYEGMVNAGFEVTSRDWVENYDAAYEQSRLVWKNVILEETKAPKSLDFFQAYSTHPYEMPDGRKIKEEDMQGADTALYVVSRIAGENADRYEKRGDYYLSEHEKEDLADIAGYCENIIVIINTGGQIDLKEILAIDKVKALLILSQPGMEGGNALADILAGDITPSGKLADTWAKNYGDFPNSASFSHNNGDCTTEKYEEGIYVGYRYFDSFEKEVEYPFGYGLSYTEFSIACDKTEVDKASVSVTVTVKNTGVIYSGKEVVQVYVSCPQGKCAKEYRRLTAFGKTRLLQPGESQQMTITFPAKELAYFDEEKSAWVVESGKYGIWIGNSSRNVSLEGVLKVEKETILEKTSHICPLTEELEEIAPSRENVLKMEEEWQKEAEAKGIREVVFVPEILNQDIIKPNKWDAFATELADKLTEEELISMVVGEIGKAQENSLGSAGIAVPGAAGETSGVLEEKYEVPGVSMADGPAGLRLINQYYVDRSDGQILGRDMLNAFEGGYFAPDVVYENADIYYQYCTAIPVGTLLAQTWDMELLEQVGRTVAVEMKEFGVAWWLAPGMNIHRNPLCGRNFEYYSEDPLVSGVMAAAITRGIQSVEGVGTTVKHFAGNNQEDNRMASNSVLSERTLREIYLKGFEIAVKSSQPMAIMTSYNLINGVHAANCKDICTVVARGEWDFQGVIMTDWTTTMPQGGSVSWKCAAAGNDLIMPGFDGDIENIREALKDGSLALPDLKACVARIIRTVCQTLGLKDSKSYQEQFSDMKPYIRVV